MNKILLTFVNLFLLVSALPSMQNVKVDNGNRLANDESDNSTGKRDDNSGPALRHDRRWTSRKSDSKCGYEVDLMPHLSI